MPDQLDDRLRLIEAIQAFAKEHGWQETQAIVEAELEGKIGRCCNCGRVTDEWHEQARRHLHAECEGEWFGLAHVKDADDLRDCA